MIQISWCLIRTKDKHISTLHQYLRRRLCLRKTSTSYHCHASHSPNCGMSQAPLLHDSCKTFSTHFGLSCKFLPPLRRKFNVFRGSALLAYMLSTRLHVVRRVADAWGDSAKFQGNQLTCWPTTCTEYAH